MKKKRLETDNPLHTPGDEWYKNVLQKFDLQTPDVEMLEFLTSPPSTLVTPGSMEEEVKNKGFFLRLNSLSLLRKLRGMG